MVETADGPPVIGVCAVAEVAQWSVWTQPAHLVAASYVDAVQAAGAVAILLPVDPRAPAAMLDRIDALLLIGGADIDPSTYGAERDPRTEATYPDRDRFEIALVHAALGRGLPMLGICRGMQLLNVALGGTLRQDLADESGFNAHRRRLGGFEGTEHAIALREGSLAARAAGALVHRVHCHHHQAVDRLADGLVASGHDEADGVVEALEADDGRWVLGVQWHPEAEPDSPILSALAAAAGASRRAMSEAA